MTVINWVRFNGQKARITFDGKYYSVAVYLDRYNVWVMYDYYTDVYYAKEWLEGNGFKEL